MAKSSFPRNFELFYNDLLCALEKVSSIKTMTQKRENKIRLENRIIYVATQKSMPNYVKIPLKIIKKSYDELLTNNEVTQSYLSETLNVKRSAFIMSAFSLLTDYITYDKGNNSIKVITK
jgi:hypothetical protein